MDGETRDWLAEQPLGQPINIGTEYVYLTVRDDGAELGAYLIQNYAQIHLETAMRNAFYSATWFNAGLGRTADGKTLVLNLWLPHVSGWQEAVEPLENLLNQLRLWRAELMPSTEKRPDKVADRTEQRLRSLLTGAKS